MVAPRTVGSPWRRFTAALAVVGSSVVLSAAPAAAESIQVTPENVARGSSAVITGDLIRCYETGPGPYSATWGLPDTIDFYWDPAPLSSSRNPNDVGGLTKVGTWTNGDKGINITFSVPANATLGRHAVVAKLQPKCNHQGLDNNGKVVEVTSEPSYMSAVFCVVKAAGDACVVGGAAPEVTGGPGEDAGGSNTGVIILVLGGVVVVTIGGLVVRGARRLPPSVEHLPPRCQGLGSALNEASANVTTLRAIERQLGDEYTLRLATQKKNLIKAALGSLVQTTIIVASGASEVAAARRAALAARSGLGVMEHWTPPTGLSPRLRAVLEVYETSLTKVRTFIDEVREKLSRLNSEVLKRIEADPAVVRARAALAEVDASLQEARAAVQRRMGSDPALSPRARYERAEGLLNGIGEGTWPQLGQANRLEEEILSARGELTNLLKYAEANKQPLETWMQEYLELQQRIAAAETAGAGTTMSPGFAQLVQRKQELESLAAKWDLTKAADLRRQIDAKSAAKQVLEEQMKAHSDAVAKIMQEHEKALVDLQNLEAAESNLKRWQASQAAARGDMEAARLAAEGQIDAERQAMLKQLYGLEDQERDLKRRRDDLRRGLEAEDALAGPAQKAAGGQVSAEQGAGLARRGLMIAGELLLGPETQSSEEIGRIIREGQEYLRLTAARRAAVQRTIERETTRVTALREALQQCVTQQGAAPAAEAQEASR